MSRPICEDAPCCGCCGTNLYGVRQDADEGPPYCDICGTLHYGDCPMDDDFEEVDDEGPDEEEAAIQAAERSYERYLGRT